jgi:tRNA U34 5-methylaminomethyl-2-thiouridine-forming methyltransferase MnmC
MMMVCMTDKKIITKDGSATFLSSEYDETYHSVSGALEEADKKYAQVCGIGSREEVDVLDICFGLGYNSAAAIDAFRGKRIRIVGLESYQGIVDEIVQMGDEYLFNCRDVMQRVAVEKRYTGTRDVKSGAESGDESGSALVEVELVMGDARETILGLGEESFDCVFLDPFSPKKCPELWTADFFKEIYRVLRAGGMVATYSCARVVRENFAAAGFSVADGPVVGRRGPGTVARKD